jgi:hypothetical protein
MAYEERRVVTAEPGDTVDTAGTVPVAESTRVVERVPTQPVTVVERPPTRTFVSEGPVQNVLAATQLIQTIIWSIVVIVLLVVALLALHVYAHLF